MKFGWTKEQVKNKKDYRTHLHHPSSNLDLKLAKKLSRPVRLWLDRTTMLSPAANKPAKTVPRDTYQRTQQSFHQRTGPLFHQTTGSPVVVERLRNGDYIVPWPKGMEVDG